MAVSLTPSKLDLKKDQGLTITWADGGVTSFTVSQLRTMCPCALCKTVRSGSDPHQLLATPAKKTSLTILPGNFAEAITVLSAELVGNYAIKLEWSDGHGSGIYSFSYLREMAGK
jgi:DUF971 family protein